MPRPVIALLTDFGTTDHYVAAVKAVVLGTCPEATLVDITHDVPAHDILAASLQLGACARYFPPATIFLVVVDPGVGSDRRGIAVEAGPYRFVAPDNGVLTHVLREWPPRMAVALTSPGYARPSISRTFEGRDRFGPAAAWLAAGAEISALGEAIDDPVRLDLPRAAISPDGVTGEVISVDRFGNLITNIAETEFAPLVSHGVIVEIQGRSVPSIVATYAEAPAGALCSLVGSSGQLEIACNRASAAAVLGLGRGARVVVRRER